MRLGFAAAAIATLVALTSCGTGSVKSAPDSSGPAVPVTTALVVQKSIPVDLQAVGNVAAYSTITVKARIGGELTKVFFQEGDSVKQGDPLFLIDPRPYEEAVRQAQANLDRDISRLNEAEANLKRDRAQEKYAREQASRYLKLHSEGVISKEQTDQTQTDADVRAEAVRADEAAIKTAKASIQADQAALEDAKLQLSYCSIRSPIDGRTGNLLVKQGNLVKANDVDLVTINQIHPIYVTFSVPEKELPSIKRYMAARKLTVFASAPTEPLQERGVLTFIDNAVDVTTGTIQLKGTFANEDGKLWPGQFVNVVLRLTEKPNALVVPVEAVQTGQKGNFIYVVKPDSTVEFRPVVTGIKTGSEIAIEQGVRVEEVVVTEGQFRLAPGTKVQAKAPLGS
jgi:multidrug efflux system membrane fusion protein